MSHGKVRARRTRTKAEVAAVLRPASSVFVITRKGNFPKGERKGYEIANFGVAGTSRKRNHLCSSTSCLSLLSFHFRAGLTAIFRCGSSMHLTSAVPSVAAAACGRFNCRAPRCSKFRLITCDLVHFEAEPCCRETLNAKGFFFFFFRELSDAFGSGRRWGASARLFRSGGAGRHSACAAGPL